MPTFNKNDIIVNRGGRLPEGFYDGLVVSFEQGKSSGGLLMFSLELRIQQPEEYRGKKFTHRFFVGKNAWKVKPTTPEEDIEYYELDDPMAEHPITKRKRYGDIIAFAEAAKWERADDEEWDTKDLEDEATGLKVGFKLRHRDQFSEAAFFYPIGTYAPSVQSSTKQAAVPNTARPTKNRTRAAIEDSED